MKHPYSPTCDCPRCQKERARRNAQAQAANLRSGGTRYTSAQGLARARRATRETPAERYARLVYNDIIREP